MKDLLPLECDYAEYMRSHEIRTRSLRRVAVVPIGDEAEFLVTAANAYYQNQGKIKIMREALTSMLYIFDRGLEKGMIGRGVCDEAKAALGDQDE